MKLTEEQYEEAVENDAGYCTECQDLRGSDVDPETDGDECPECHNDTLIGLDQALSRSEIEIEDEETDDDDDLDDEPGLED